MHHAFTSPAGPRRPSTRDPGNALAWAYDIVCNGNEIGGGSIRIHREDVQKRVFAVMGIGEEEAQEKFGFLLDAFKYGAPPHGGIAFGWDRIVALLAGHRLDPRRHRVPEVRWRLRPADRGAGADHAGAAQGGRRRRRAQAARATRRSRRPSVSDDGGLFDVPGAVLRTATRERLARRQHARLGAAAGPDAAAHARRAGRPGAAAGARARRCGS